MVLAGFLVELGAMALFVGDALSTLACAALIYRTVPESRPAPTPGDAAAEGSGPFRNPVFLALAFLSCLLGMLILQFMSTLPISMRRHGLSGREFGLVLALNGVVIIVLQPWASRWVRRFPPGAMMALASLLVGGGFGLTGLARGALGHAASVVVWTLGEIVWQPVASAVVAALAPPSMRGRYQGAFFMTWAVAALAGPSLGTLVMDCCGESVLWAGCAGLGVVMAIGHGLIAGPRRRRLATLVTLR